MNIKSSYAVEIKHIKKLFRQTIAIYSDAISYCIKVFENEWNDLKDIPIEHKMRFAYSENLIHNTKSNEAKYDFDKKFPNLPTYLRRAVINAALGYLSSYHSNLDNWYENKCQGKKPTLQTHQNKLPVFYKGNMYGETDKDDVIKLKVFVNNSWNWVSVNLSKTDIKNIKKRIIENDKISAPTLERKNKKWFLRFAFEKKQDLNKTKMKDQVICAVDLGINTDATCSIMKSDGTILSRKFIDFPSDKDLINHTLNKIKGIQQKYGYHNIGKLWRYAKFHNDELAKKVATVITEYAKDNDCSVIVFEHLDTKGKKHGRKKQKLAMWKKNTIQKIVEHKAHRYGMRISRICAWFTSKLAYDGSGAVLRGRDANLNTYELCKFANGKIYNCDLSASYNIGARYFIRELQKSISATKWSDIVAKVPECEKRTKCTYSTLIKLNKVA